MVDCGHDARDSDCPFCITAVLRDAFAQDAATAAAVRDAFAGLDVPFTDSSNGGWQ